MTIYGSGFVGATSVAFGEYPASSFSLVSNTEITASSPANPNTNVTVDVTVTAPTDTSQTNPADQFFVLGPPPTITGISPGEGSTSGGTKVTVAGTNFEDLSSVWLGAFDDLSVKNFTYVSPTLITLVTPSSPTGGIRWW